MVCCTTDSDTATVALGSDASYTGNPGSCGTERLQSSRDWPESRARFTPALGAPPTELPAPCAAPVPPSVACGDTSDEEEDPAAAASSLLSQACSAAARREQCSTYRRPVTASTTCWLETFSHTPSQATTRNRSAGLSLVTVTSGSAVRYGRWSLKGPTEYPGHLRNAFPNARVIIITPASRSNAWPCADGRVDRADEAAFMEEEDDWIAPAEDYTGSLPLAGFNSERAAVAGFECAFRDAAARTLLDDAAPAAALFVAASSEFGDEGSTTAIELPPLPPARRLSFSSGASRSRSSDSALASIDSASSVSCSALRPENSSDAIAADCPSSRPGAS